MMRSEKQGAFLIREKVNMTTMDAEKIKEGEPINRVVEDFRPLANHATYAMEVHIVK